MGLVLKRIDDPRDALEKARRIDMERYAAQHNIEAIKPGMPAILMRRILRSQGVTNVGGRKRTLGIPDNGMARPPQAPMDGPPVGEIDAADALMKEWESGSMAPLDPLAGLDDMKIWDLRRMCKDNGIRLKQTMKGAEMREQLRAKLNGQDAT